MLQSFQHLYFYTILFLLGCAAVGPPSGGSTDTKGPKLIFISPSSVLNLSNEQKITFEFDELIDPVSVPSSVQISSELNYKLKIRGRKIIIQPDKTWPENDLIRISLSRRIRDYQKNMMAEAVIIIFSTGSEIPEGIINGSVIEYDNKNLVELGLYEWPLSDSSQYIQKIESDELGNFQFTGIKNGQYTLGAIEGSLQNMNQQIEIKRYAILTFDFISISTEENVKTVKMLLSEPLERQQITSIEMLSQRAFNLIMDDNSKEYFMIDSSYKPGDSISVNLKKTNRLEAYMLPEYSFILPEITDTLGPKLNISQFINGEFILEFSEPIYIDTNAFTIKRDTLNIPLLFTQTTNNTVILPNLADTIYNIYIWGASIHDSNGNYFIDSVKTVRISRPQNTENKKIIGGNILGLVEYDGNKPIKIEAHNIKNNSYYFADVINKKFKFSNLPSGLYELWGFELLNYQNPDIYFSGLWQPYQRAARFEHYVDTVDVRARWDIEGILIKFD
jgi:hypothetical protein